MAKLELKSLNKNKLKFSINDTSPGYSNAIRRIILTHVPVMAIENVEIRKNSSALYDEMLAHRLGLIALTTDLKSYDLPKSEEEIEEKKAKCTVQLVLKEKGPKTIYASDLKTVDPKIKPVHPQTLIVKLLKDQELELVATAVLGIGNNHMKWSPGHVWYSYAPKITVSDKVNHADYKDVYPDKIFKNDKIDPKAIIDNELVDAVAHVNNNVINVEFDEKVHIFIVESWGQLSPKEIVSEAINIFDLKLDELKKLVK